jgi:glucuronokinase
MITITAFAHARAGLLGNPSDAYFGKCISFIIKNFRARVILDESETLRIEMNESDRNIYKSIDDLANSVRTMGYYGGIRLIKAGIKVFYSYCKERNIRLRDDNFAVRYDSDIPRQVGLGGSSAIVTAMLCGLMQFYDVDIPKNIQPNLILSAEKDELGISAGYMDRVVQVYEGCVYMDLNEQLFTERGFGEYEPMNPEIMPSLYLAYDADSGKVSGKVHDDLRHRFEKGDTQVIRTLKRIANLTDKGKKALMEGDAGRLHALIDENFDLRSRIMEIRDSDREMIQTARRIGASAKFAGSGGSVVGTYENEDMFLELADVFNKMGVTVIKPVVV